MGKRKRKGAKGPKWVARVPVQTPDGSFFDVEKTQDQLRVLHNKLLGFGIKAVNRARCRVSKAEKDLIRGIKDPAMRGQCWQKLNSENGFSHEAIREEAKRLYPKYKHTDSVTAQSVADKVYETLEKHAKGQIGRHRFKKKGQGQRRGKQAGQGF
jgi:hypothetical protein